MLTNNTSWLFLLIAIPFSVLGTLAMKLSYGLKKWKPTLCLIIAYLISFTALTFAVQGIELSIVYAIWSGVGTLLVTFIGFFLFKEKISFHKIISLIFIIIGVIGIHLHNELFSFFGY